MHHWTNIKLASVTYIVRVAGDRMLQYRTLLLIKAMGTKIVLRLAAFVIRLERINKNAVGKLPKLISRLPQYPNAHAPSTCVQARL